MPLGEVLGRDPPTASHADHDRAEVVDRKRDEPDRNALSTLEKAREHEQRGADDRRGRESENRAPAVESAATNRREPSLVAKHLG